MTRGISSIASAMTEINYLVKRMYMYMCMYTYMLVATKQAVRCIFAEYEFACMRYAWRRA
jgi:hypothetical protein